MSERWNFICIADRTLSPQEYQSTIEQILELLHAATASPIEVMLVDSNSNSEEIRSWESSASLFNNKIELDQILVTYFVVDGESRFGRQSVSLQTHGAVSVITISLNPKILNASVAEFSSVAVLARFAGWAMLCFEHSALACGPELDLYQIGQKIDVQQAAEALLSDWRCEFSISTHRSPAFASAKQTSDFLI